MREITRLELMRAVYWHKLNAKNNGRIIPPSNPDGEIITEHSWYLDQDWQHPFATTRHPDCLTSEERKRKITCRCTESFYEKYVRTTPDKAYHCRTCAFRGECPIEREDKEEFCNNWQDAL